jgi:hypothetical protein
MSPGRLNCPKSIRDCAGPGDCPGCRVQAAIHNCDAERIRMKLMLLWEGKPIKATPYRELMRTLDISEAEARELECQEQVIVDQEVARFPKSIH